MSRSGRFVKQGERYLAFLPAPLPPQPSLDIDPDLLRLLSDADQKLAQFHGVTAKLQTVGLS